MKSKKLQHLPDFYFITCIFLAGIDSAGSISPIYFIPIFLFFLNIVSKNRLLNRAIASVLLIVNLLFFLALISEFKEFKIKETEAWILISTGLAIWISNFLMIAIMFYRYSKTSTPSLASLAQD